MYLYYVPWLNLISCFYYHNMPVKETNNLHPQMMGREGEHKATRKVYQQHQTTRTGTASSSGSLANTKLGSKGRFDDTQQCFLSACESQSHTIYWRQPKHGWGKSGALQVQPGRHSGSWRYRAPATSPQVQLSPQWNPEWHLPPMTSLKLFFCFPTQATAWLLWHSCSHAVW